MRFLFVIAVAGCNFAKPIAYGACSSDSECASGTVCARTGDCVAPRELAPAIAITWTFHGEPADATWCAQFPAADLVLTSDDGNPDLIVRDLPCSTAGVVLDRIPRDLPFFQLGISGTPMPARLPDPNWDAHYVAPGTTHIAFALAP
jgi:hypothetical protein